MHTSSTSSPKPTDLEMALEISWASSCWSVMSWIRSSTCSMFLKHQQESQMSETRTWPQTRAQTRTWPRYLQQRIQSRKTVNSNTKLWFPSSNQPLSEVSCSSSWTSCWSNREVVFYTTTLPAVWLQPGIFSVNATWGDTVASGFRLCISYMFSCADFMALAA